MAIGRVKKYIGYKIRTKYGYMQKGGGKTIIATKRTANYFKKLYKAQHDHIAVSLVKVKSTKQPTKSKSMGGPLSYKQQQNMFKRINKYNAKKR